MEGKETDYVICTRCGRHRAHSEVGIRKLRDAFDLHVAAPPIPPGVCWTCIREDPALNSALGAWLTRYSGKLVRPIREAIARPLEIIDDFVAHFQ